MYEFRKISDNSLPKRRTLCWQVPAPMLISDDLPLVPAKLVNNLFIEMAELLTETLPEYAADHNSQSNK